MNIYTKIAEDLKNNGVVVESFEQLAQDDYFREYLSKYNVKSNGLARVFFSHNGKVLLQDAESMTLFYNIYDFFNEDNEMIEEYIAFIQSDGKNQLSNEFYGFCAERIIDNMEVA
ncbi:hypothetical protein [Schinkia azotoformans]|uniref:hypothetical protein n=1 Tax=Schinkia azotoformans TaxID=1454 RepID=UPI002DBF0144|nr:hypothetical protein [Schinkia azotoformans]MEC1786071.1 hypothetical protein [Schinkia azotoformans]MED4420107.1 hypothetical protein [Schinkia azotoformans]